MLTDKDKKAIKSLSQEQKLSIPAIARQLGISKYTVQQFAYTFENDISDELGKQIINYYLKDVLSVAKTAKHFGLSVPKVNGYIKSKGAILGLINSGKAKRKQSNDRVVEEYKKGKKVYTIARELGIGAYMVKRILIDNNLYVPNKKYKWKKKDDCNVYADAMRVADACGIPKCRMWDKIHKIEEVHGMTYDENNNEVLS